MTLGHSISISTFTNESGKDRLQLAQKAVSRFREDGYFRVTDHGIDPEVSAHLPSIAKPFFELPLEIKLKYLALKGLGYLPSPDSVNLPVTGNPHSPHEQLIIHLDEQRNLWPEELPDFRQIVSTYNICAERLCRNIARMIALGVGVPEDNVIERDDAPNASFLKFIAWRPEHAGTRQTDCRLAAHHDYAVVSLLNNAHHSNGLQVRHNHRWVEAYAGSGELLVFLGEQMTRWTDGLITPTWHRVANHSDDYSNDNKRYSSCYFYNPEPMVKNVEGYLAGRAKYCKACETSLSGEQVDKQTWTRRFRWS